MKLPSFVIKGLLSRRNFEVDFGFINDLGFMHAIPSAVMFALARIFDMYNHNLLSLLACTAGFTIVGIGISLILIEPQVIYGLNIGKLFNNQTLAKINIESIVEKSLSKNDFDLLMHSKELIAKFRVGLYDVLKNFVKSLPSDYEPSEEDVVRVIELYTDKFRQKYLDVYKQKIQCCRHKAFEKIKQEIQNV